MSASPKIERVVYIPSNIEGAKERTLIASSNIEGIVSSNREEAKEIILIALSSTEEIVSFEIDKIAPIKLKQKYKYRVYKLVSYISRRI